MELFASEHKSWFTLEIQDWIGTCGLERALKKGKVLSWVTLCSYSIIQASLSVSQVNVKITPIPLHYLAGVILLLLFYFYQTICNHGHCNIKNTYQRNMLKSPPMQYSFFFYPAISRVSLVMYSYNSPDRTTIISRNDNTSTVSLLSQSNQAH